jgi:hypothetical protein
LGADPATNELVRGIELRKARAQDLPIISARFVVVC